MPKKKKCPPKGAPTWMVTFGDLMSILVVFFVLMLSFSETDAVRFREVIDSLKYGFGVQRVVLARETPMGTSPIFDHFSPGDPTVTIMDDMQQQTADVIRDVVARPQDFVDEILDQDLRERADDLARALETEIRLGLIELETLENEILVRIREQGYFASGQADLQPNFFPILDRISEVLKQTRGALIVAGHTDDVPISTARFPSNWMLSAARAANVVDYFSRIAPELEDRLQIRGHADTRPLAPNDTAERRARNRRVEIVVAQRGGVEPRLLSYPYADEMPMIYEDAALPAP